MDDTQPKSLLRRTLPWLGVVLVAAIIYDGTIFYSRWSDDRDAARARAAKDVEEKRKVVAMLGGDAVTILSFYAAPGVIKPGQTASVCYGVSNAKTVKLEPAIEDVWPSLSRCLQVSPSRDTEYKLTAEDATGHSVSQSFVLKVAR
jgi:hypothetical protein